MNKKLQFKKSPSLREGFRIGLIVFLSLGICTAAFAQTQQSNFINYQGVASDAAGTVMAEQSITVGIVLRYATTGAAEYAENHSITTDVNGVFSLKIGNGSATTGTYNTFQWPGIAVFLTVSINGTEIGTTELLAVPYAINAGNTYWSKEGDNIENFNTGIVKVRSNLEVGANIQLQLGPAANEISIDGTLAGNSDKAIPTEKAVKSYVDANGSSGLERITEGSNTGWRLVGTNPANYGPIGKNAVDLSYSSDESNVYGATENRSIAMGSYTTASGWSSTAMGSVTTASEFASTSMGNNTIASGEQSTAMGLFTTASGVSSTSMGNETIASGKESIAMGYRTKAESLMSMAIGSKNIGGFTDNPGTDNDGDKRWFGEDPLFEIGNASVASSTRKNALTVLKNGKVGIGRHTPTSLLEVAHQQGSPSSANRTNAFSIRNLGTGRSWQLYTESNGYLLLFNDGDYRGSFNAATGAYNVASDKRVKKDITPLVNGTLQKVMQLNPVSYLMIDQKDTKRNLGLISQEVKEIFPSITHYAREQDLLTLSYTELIPVLIKALQEQQTIIEGQNIKINGLSTEVGQIKTILKKLSLTSSIASKE